MWPLIGFARSGRQPLAAPAAACSQDRPPTAAAHPLPEPMTPRPAANVRLVRPLHFRSSLRRGDPLPSVHTQRGGSRGTDASGRLPRGPSSRAVRTRHRTQLDRLTLRGRDVCHNRAAASRPVSSRGVPAGLARAVSTAQANESINRDDTEGHSKSCRRRPPSRGARFPATTNTAGPSNSRSIRPPTPPAPGTSGGGPYQKPSRNRERPSALVERLRHHDPQPRL